jgi:hypothetical protein
MPASIRPARFSCLPLKHGDTEMSVTELIGSFSTVFFLEVRVAGRGPGGYTERQKHRHFEYPVAPLIADY